MSPTDAADALQAALPAWARAELPGLGTELMSAHPDAALVIGDLVAVLTSKNKTIITVKPSLSWEHQTVEVGTGGRMQAPADPREGLQAALVTQLGVSARAVLAGTRSVGEHHALEAAGATLIARLAAVAEARRQSSSRPPTVRSESWLIPEALVPEPLRAEITAALGWVRADRPGARVTDTHLLERRLGAQILASLPAPLAALHRGTLIHGDGLHAGTVCGLAPEAQGGTPPIPMPPVGLVYADPPYNTGLASMPYPDALPSGAWLSMVVARLATAWALLGPDGAMFCSIDDTELFRLQIALEQRLGSDAFLCTMPWVKRYAPPPDVSGIGYVHEVVLAWRRSPAFRPALLPMTSAQVARYKNPDDDPRGPWKSMDYTCRYTREERPNLYYPVRQPGSDADVLPKDSRMWAFSRETHQRNVAEDRLWWGRDGRNRVPALKNFLSDVRQGMPATTLLTHEVAGHTDGAARELRAVLPGVKFTPKPTRLIRHLATIAGLAPGEAVLDPFAGSGSTGAAMLQWERETGTARPFVLAEAGEAFDRLLLPRIARLTGAGTWKRGRAESDDALPVVHRVMRLDDPAGS